MPRTGSSRKAKSADRVTYLPPKEQSTSRPSSAPSLQQVLRAGGEAPEAARPQAWAVGLNRVTLAFSNGALDVEWRRLVANRTRALWMRSLLSAVVYQALRHAADLAEFGGSTTSTIVCRLCLACFQLTIYCLAYFDLVAPSQWAIALNAFSYGVVELLLLVRSLSPRVNGAGKESDIPNFKGSYLGRFPLVSADFWTSDHLSERSRRVGAFSGTRARGTLTLKRR